MAERANSPPRRKLGHDSKPTTTTSRRAVQSSKGGKNHRKTAADTGADAKNNAGHYTALEGETAPGSVATSRPTTSHDKRDSMREEFVDDGWETDFENVEDVRRICKVDPYLAACKSLGIVPSSYFASKYNSESTEILMRYHGIGPKGAQAIADVLKVPNSVIIKLDLADNRLGVGASHLGLALEINRTLAHLDISGNKLGAEGCKELADMLQYNVTVKTLRVRGNHIGDRGAQYFAAGLRSNSTLTSLDLSRNDIGDMGAVALGQSLSGNDGLKELDISWNNIRIPGFSAFFTSLRDNAVLSHLKIHHNGIGDATAPLALYLTKSPALQTLDLTSTRLSDAAVATLARALEASNALKEVEFANNPLTDPSAQIILRAATNSNSLKKLNVKEIQMSDETRNKFMALKSEKSVIVDL